MYLCIDLWTIIQCVKIKQTKVTKTRSITLKLIYSVNMYVLINRLKYKMHRCRGNIRFVNVYGKYRKGFKL